MSGGVDITPGTKIGALLDARPELEAVLVGIAPEFSKLGNPVLRKTIGRVATLARAAKMADLDPVGLVNRLRAAAGLEPLADAGGEGGEGPGPDAASAWADAVTVRCTVDAEALLDAGENPLEHARRALRALAPGEALVIRSTFRPVPLEEALRREAGVRVAVRRGGPGWETVVARGEPPRSAAG